jgi:hypothetical protein
MSGRGNQTNLGLEKFAKSQIVDVTHVILAGARDLYLIFPHVIFPGSRDPCAKSDGANLRTIAIFLSFSLLLDSYRLTDLVSCTVPRSTHFVTTCWSIKPHGIDSCPPEHYRPGKVGHVIIFRRLLTITAL